MIMVGVDSSSPQVDLLLVSWLGRRVVSHLALFYIHHYY